jgi:hypothetical protein
MARVLIACEQSGVMRRAFAALGHDAWSCDLLPSDDGSKHHICGDVRDYLGDGWDLLVAHPPCTRLCNSGVRWYHEPPKNPPSDATPIEKSGWAEMTREEKLAVMWRLLKEGAELFSTCWKAPIERVALENPIMSPHAKALMPADLPRPQIVQPWWFGERACKATGFYLRGLPMLTPTDKLTPPKRGNADYAAWHAVHRASPGPDRWKLRSRTFEGVAAACAAQWGGHAAAQHMRTA